ncbi:MAG: YajQ family cyclic di-GMP-binding protein [Actinobacteria bacterium RBG_16_68_21]|nr:MAG: YajQ family cyclic di-GMP-binding protein [Actinobacteria bacterium RBG_16_68_21]
MPTFDVVSQVNLQEVRNAVDQANRETATRYDFKGSDTKAALGDDAITVESSTEDRLKAAVDVLKEKLVRRKVSLKSLAGGDPQQIGGGRYKAVFALNQGLDADSARFISKRIRDSGLKVQAQINGDLVRVTAKKRDDLQEVIADLREMDFKLPLQYINYRD